MAAKASSIAAAERYVTAGQTAEAVVEYRNAIQADPQDGGLRLKLAELYAKTGNSRAAAREYIRAADLLPARGDVQLRAGSLLLLDGSFDDAKVRAQKALAIDPRNVDAQVLLANSLAGLKDFNAAVAGMEQAIRLDPERGTNYATLGSLQLRRGDLEAAERAYRKATALDPNSAPAHLALANFYWSQGRLDDADQELHAALQLDPQNVLAHRAMASFALGRRDMPRAEMHLLKVVELTKSADASLALADFYLATGRPPAARKALQPLSGAPQVAGRVAPRLAAMDYASGDRKAAFAKIDEALAADGSNLEALLAKSNMLLADGKADEAAAAAESAAGMHPESAEAYFALGRAQMVRQNNHLALDAMNEASRLSPNAIGPLLALAQLNHSSRRYADAVVFAERALKADPSNRDARLVLIRALIARDELDRAERELALVPMSGGNAAAIHAQKGILLTRRRAFDKARAEFAEALRLQPKSVEAVSGLAVLELENGRVEAARNLAAEHAQNESSTALMMVAARTYLASGELSAGEDTLRRVLKKDPSHLPAYLALGQLYVKQRRLDAALAEFDTLARRDSRPVAPLTVAGMILQALGRNQEARERFERALAIDAGAPVAANNLAWILATTGGDLNTALPLAETARRALPNAPEVNDTLGFIYYRKNLLPMAIRSLKAAVDADESEPVYRYHLGLALAKSGDVAGARDQLTRALSLKPDFDGSADARAALQKLTVP